MSDCYGKGYSSEADECSVCVDMEHCKPLTISEEGDAYDGVRDPVFPDDDDDEGTEDSAIKDEDEPVEEKKPMKAVKKKATAKKATPAKKKVAAKKKPPVAKKAAPKKAAAKKAAPKKAPAKKSAAKKAPTKSNGENLTKLTVVNLLGEGSIDDLFKKFKKTKHFSGKDDAYIRGRARHMRHWVKWRANKTGRKIADLG